MSKSRGSVLDGTQLGMGEAARGPDVSAARLAYRGGSRGPSLPQRPREGPRPARRFRRSEVSEEPGRQERRAADLGAVVTAVVTSGPLVLTAR
jgi:hypothetical protein